MQNKNKNAPLMHTPFGAALAGARDTLPTPPQHAVEKAKAKEKEPEPEPAARKNAPQQTDVIEVDYLRRLSEKGMHHRAIGAAIGYPQTAVSGAIGAGIAPLRMELAAEAIYRRGEKPVFAEPPPLMKDGDLFVSMKIDAAALAILEPWLKDVGADVKVF